MADGTISIDVELNEKAFQAALQNMGQIVNSGANLMIKSVENLSGSFVLLPDMIDRVFKSVPNIIYSVINRIAEQSPVMTATGNDFFMSFIGRMPEIIENITKVIPGISGKIIEDFTDFIPEMTDTGSKFFTSVISNMPGIISEITKAVPDMTAKIDETIKSDIPLISQTGFEMFCALREQLPSAIELLLTAPPDIVNSLVEVFTSLMPQFNSVGTNIIQGVWAGISGMGSWLSSQVTGFFQGVVNGVTGFLGISSPSRLFRDKIGKNIVLGLKAGISDEMPGVVNDMQRQMSILSDAATNIQKAENKVRRTEFLSTQLKPNAGDIINRTNSNISGIAEILNSTKSNLDIFQSQLSRGNEQSSTTPNINVTLEPTGDMRGFFDYISMGVKRIEYLNGGMKI